MINNILDEIWGVRTEPCGLRRDEPNWREVCFQINVSIYLNYDACPSSMIQIYKWICNPKKGLDCGHGIGSQQRRPNDEQTTETPFLSRCHMILMFKTVSGSHYSIFISYLLLQVWAGATWWFFRNRFRIALFVSYLLLQVCPYKIQPEKQGKLIWITGPPGLGMKLFFFHLDFHFLNILQSNFSQLPFTHLPMAFLGTKLLQYGFSFKLAGFPCYHVVYFSQRKVNERSASGTKTWLCFLWGRLLFHHEVTFSLTTVVINCISPGILSSL